jgi:hypothetical protein
MNIEHDGKTYEVLTLDRISEITHAKLAGGVVLSAFIGGNTHLYVKLLESDKTCRHVFWPFEFTSYNIQPLRLVPKEPVTFEADSMFVRDDIPVILIKKEYVGKRFRCVEIMEEA